MIKHVVLISLFSIPALYAFSRPKEVTVHTELKVHNKHSWSQSSGNQFSNQFKSEKVGIKFLFEYLKKSATGRKLVFQAEKKAKTTDEELINIVSFGSGSLTDTTLIRKFSPSNPYQVSYESRSKVFINKDLQLLEAVLDLAHELTHFIYRKPFNPYVKAFSLKAFIQSTVEGKGGEVDAYLMECKVYSELFASMGPLKNRCSSVYNSRTGKLSRLKGVKEFYKVGGHVHIFKDEAIQHGLDFSQFPHLSSDQSKFISSAYGLPYPLAALREYLHVMKNACRNDQRRISLLNSTDGRSPSSVGGSRISHLERSFRERCHAFL